MSESVLPHFAIGWQAFKANPFVFVASMLVLLASWVVVEVAVIALQRFGIIVWLFLHLGFFVFFSCLMAGFHRIALMALNGEAPEFADLTASFRRGPTFLLALCIYVLSVAGGLVLLVLPGVYVAIRYAFFGHAIAAKPISALEALGISSALSKGRWWTLYFFWFLALSLNLAGAALLGIGLFFTFPVSVLAASDFYRSLSQPAP